MGYNRDETNYKITHVNLLQIQLYNNCRSRKEAIEDMLRREEYMGLDAGQQKVQHEK